MPAKNVVIFGETGVGKSSVLNLMAGKKMAKTSPDMKRCTLQSQKYRIGFDQHEFKVFDTVGLEEPQIGMTEYLKIIESAYNLITGLQKEGGIDLLLFCMRGGRVTATIQTNYRLFYEWLCEKKVPVVLVITGLEREDEMEEWWFRNKQVLDRYGIHVSGHACITAADKLEGSTRYGQLYETSRHLVRELVIEHTSGGQNASLTDEGLFARFIRFLRELLLGKPQKGDIVTILTKRCNMPPEAAKQLASNISRSEGAQY